MTSLHATYPRLHDRPERVSDLPAHPTPVTARLSLFINGIAYNVRPLVADPGFATRAFRLRKFDGTEYDLAETDRGLICDCPDFTFKREGIDPEGCKHIQALVDCGLLEPMREEEPAAVAMTSPAEPYARKPAAIGEPADGLAVPANGQPTTFLEVVEHEAMGYRAWGTDVGGFLADQLGRIAQLIRWTGAKTPEDHEDRMALYDEELRERHYEQGYHDGLEAGRREARAEPRHRLD